MSEEDARYRNPPKYRGIDPSPGIDETEQHSVSGVGGETAVWCPFTEQLFGPGGISHFEYCPYCGSSVEDEDHSVDTSVDEVFCPDTTMSTYRYCPNCGDRAGEQ